MFAYPAIPLISSSTTGLLGWHSRAAVVTDLEQLNETRGTNYAAIREAELDEIVADAQMASFAQAYGAAAFRRINCAGCHGAGGGGGPGYPNLLDDDWLWGGALDDIHQTVAFGIRATHDETRFGDMPAFVRWMESLIATKPGPATDYVARHGWSFLSPTTRSRLSARVYCAKLRGLPWRRREGIAGAGSALETLVIAGFWLYGSDREQRSMTGIVNDAAPVDSHFGETFDDVTIKSSPSYCPRAGRGE